MTLTSQKPRDLLAEAQAHYAAAGQRLADRQAQIARLKSEAAAAQDDLQAFDAATAESFSLAAQSDEPGALDAVRVDHRKRDALLKKLAAAQARAIGAQAAIVKLQDGARADQNARTSAERLIPICQMLVMLEEQVPPTIQEVLDLSGKLAARSAKIQLIRSTLVDLAHAQPQDSPYRRDLLVKLEEFEALITASRPDADNTAAAATAHAELAAFISTLDGQKEPAYDTAA
jgi:predicted phage tail protein